MLSAPATSINPTGYLYKWKVTAEFRSVGLTKDERLGMPPHPYYVTTDRLTWNQDPTADGSNPEPLSHSIGMPPSGITSSPLVVIPNIPYRQGGSP